MKKKNLASLKLRKNKISNLNLLSSKLGGFLTNDTLIENCTIVETNPNFTLYTCYCGETETCETGCGGCNTNTNTEGKVTPSVEVICNNVIGSIGIC